MLGFTLNFIKKKKSNSKSKASYLSKIESSVTGIVYINNEGNFVINVDGTYYTPTKESLITKKKAFLFDEIHKRIICVILNDFNTTNLAFPYMPLAPGYLVVGDIVKDINNNKYFDITKILNEFNINARKEFWQNKTELIKLYNERHCSTKSS